MRVILSIFFLLAFVGARAEEIFPVGCTPLVLHDEAIKLSAEKPVLVMLHNLSKIDLWMIHPESESSAHASWSSLLQAGRWSALALDKKLFELSCIESRPGHEQQVPCAGLVVACQWHNVKGPKKESGTFWAGEDMRLSALTAHVGSRGFILAAPAQSVLD